MATRTALPPGRWSCPRATGLRPVGPSPRLGQLEMRLGPARVRYRETATPETDPPSAFHRPVLILERRRARSSRLRVTLPRCRPPRGARRRRCRPHRLTLLAFACAFVVPRSLPTSQSQGGEEPAQKSTRACFLHLRCFIGSPVDGSRLPSQQPRGGAWDPECLVDRTREPGQRRKTPACPRAVRSPYRHSKPQHDEDQDRAGRRPGTAPARLLDPAATYNTTLTALRSTDRSASACSCAADRAEFAPARPIAGGSGGRSQRSLP